MTFKGFAPPQSNYSKLPHEFIDLLPIIDSMAELKVMIYILRHTWGFSEYDKPKKITLDEFCNGRKRRNGTRFDNGTGMATNSVKSGVEKAISHGFLSVEVDDRDKARIEKYYCLNINSDNQDLTPDYQDLIPRLSKVDNRTEKETIEKNNRKKEIESTKKQRGRKGDLVDGLIELSQMPGVKKQIRLEGIQSRIAVALNINCTWSRWERFIRFADKQEQEQKQTVEQFTAWLKSKPGFDISYWPPDKMQEVWPQAFIENPKESDDFEVL